MCVAEYVWAVVLGKYHKLVSTSLVCSIRSWHKAAHICRGMCDVLVGMRWDNRRDREKALRQRERLNIGWECVLSGAVECTPIFGTVFYLLSKFYCNLRALHFIGSSLCAHNIFTHQNDGRLLRHVTCPHVYTYIQVHDMWYALNMCTYIASLSLYTPLSTILYYHAWIPLLSVTLQMPWLWVLWLKFRTDALHHHISINKTRFSPMSSHKHAATDSHTRIIGICIHSGWLVGWSALCWCGIDCCRFVGDIIAPV